MSPSLCMATWIGLSETIVACGVAGSRISEKTIIAAKMGRAASMPSTIRLYYERVNGAQARSFPRGIQTRGAFFHIQWMLARMLAHGRAPAYRSRIERFGERQSGHSAQFVYQDALEGGGWTASPRPKKAPLRPKKAGSDPVQTQGTASKSSFYFT